MMEGFRKFLLENEEKENVQKMIRQLPKGHQRLLRGWKFKYQPGNTLDGDDDHIGLIHNDKITVAAPWNYGRCFTTLHEIAHLVWEHKMTPDLKKKWEALVSETKAKHKSQLPKDCHAALDQNAEEIFCMAYATAYSKHPVITYNNKAWIAFIKNKVPE